VELDGRIPSTVGRIVGRTVEQLRWRVSKFIFNRIKKDEGQGKEKCHAKSMMSNEANERIKYTLSMCRQVEHGGKSTREGAKRGVGRRERMKCGIGMKDREERSKGIEIHISDAFDIIKPTAPFKLTKHEA
jgi:hypothetical protein